jgi:hypothetical protein
MVGCDSKPRERRSDAYTDGAGIAIVTYAFHSCNQVYLHFIYIGCEPG